MHFQRYSHLAPLPQSFVRVTPKDEPKVDVEQAPIRGEHEILEMAIANPEDVSDHAVARTTLDERDVCGFRIVALRKERRQAGLLPNRLQRVAVRHKLHNARF